MAAVVGGLAVPVGASAHLVGPAAKNGMVAGTASSSAPAARDGAAWLRGAKATLGQRNGAFSLPADARNVELISKLPLDNEFGSVAPEQVADVVVHKTTAYVMSWATPVEGTRCRRGGFWSVDISKPAAPVQLNFIRALDRNYHGEGAHVITFPDGRDILAVNNETCSASTPQRGGGFDLYDVTDPGDPVALVQAAGDYSDVLGTLVCCTRTAAGANEPISHEYHSVWMWRAGAKVYLVGVDNDEQTRTDLDIFDITDPTAPKAVAEYDLDQEFGLFEPGEEVLDNDRDVDGNYLNTLLHDMVVKEINGVPTMLASYWDGGYVMLDVSDPANAQYIGDTTFKATDPLTGLQKSTGNAHQAEFSYDNRFILGADEDFNTHRALGRVDPGGPDDFAFESFGPADAGPPFTADTVLDGQTVFAGKGCAPANYPDNVGGDPTKIALIERGGACAFRTMVQSAEARGYRTLLMFNDNTAGQGCEWLGVIPLQGYTGNTMMLFIPRTIGMRLLGAYNPQTYKCTEGNNANTTPAPAAPMNGKRVTLRALFDGWGYAHLYRTGSGKLTEVDAYAVDEALDEDFATGFGDLSIHEWATDPNANIAYSSYYGAGLRVVRFGDSGIEETGHFVDDGGNNFWGVEQFTTDEQQPRRLIAASDRDFGLYIFRYTGPDAPVLPPKQSPPQNPPLQAPVTPAAPKDATKPRIVSLSSANKSLKKLRAGKLAIRLRLDEASRVQITLQGRLTRSNGKRGSLSRLARTTVANFGANRTRTVTLKLSSATRKKLRREKRLPARLSFSVTDVAGNVTTRNVTLTFR